MEVSTWRWSPLSTSLGHHERLTHWLIGVIGVESKPQPQHGSTWTFDKEEAKGANKCWVTYIQSATSNESFGSRGNCRRRQSAIMTDEGVRATL
mmetsp:Transcript_60716/g.128523  ORF Transcript_60716/g.128523 Transcript_60716/m.128523 type:complete len:94 (+) Transcript_60716:57-338(+)